MFPDDLCGPKAVIAALRLRGGGRKEKLDRCRREAELYTGCGVSALLIADRGAELQDLAAALELLRRADEAQRQDEPRRAALRDEAARLEADLPRYAQREALRRQRAELLAAAAGAERRMTSAPRDVFWTLSR